MKGRARKNIILHQSHYSIS